ncbi:PilW family protein [Ideonella sp. DXS29W]|uniref:PilW family protein n=1 Tax=Ideonella lacteola TaxID=2984193 RepID=A0ABU9BHI2_9BURK
MIQYTKHRLHGARAQGGFSLIELMISLVIGLVVVGAVFAAYLSTGTSGRNGRALSQVTEDASIALNVLRTGVAMVGYGAPQDFDKTTGRFVKQYAGVGIFGCDSAFSDLGKPIDQLTCNAKGDADSVAVAYQADQWNSVTSSNVPLDCLGGALTAVSGMYLNYSRYYVQDGQLLCRGPANDAGQALVDNVVDLQIRYGVANRVNGTPDSYGAAYYATADEIGAVPNSAGWTNVVAVRICVVVRSAENALNESVGTYQGCSGPVEVKDDGDLRMYRAFTTTVVLQNRLGAVL